MDESKHAASAARARRLREQATARAASAQKRRMLLGHVHLAKREAIARATEQAASLLSWERRRMVADLEELSRMNDLGALRNAVEAFLANNAGAAEALGVHAGALGQALQSSAAKPARRLPPPSSVGAAHAAAPTDTDHWQEMASATKDDDGGREPMPSGGGTLPPMLRARAPPPRVLPTGDGGGGVSLVSPRTARVRDAAGTFVQ